MVSSYSICGVTKHLRDGEHWCSTDRLVFVHLTRIWRPGGAMKISHLQMCVEGLNREAEGRWSQVRLPEHSKEAKGETHPQSRTDGPQAGGDDAEVMEEWR